MNDLSRGRRETPACSPPQQPDVISMMGLSNVFQEARGGSSELHPMGSCPAAAHCSLPSAADLTAARSPLTESRRGTAAAVTLCHRRLFSPSWRRQQPRAWLWGGGRQGEERHRALGKYYGMPQDVSWCLHRRALCVCAGDEEHPTPLPALRQQNFRGAKRLQSSSWLRPDPVPLWRFPSAG